MSNNLLARPRPGRRRRRHRTATALLLTVIAVAVPCGAWYFAGSRGVDRRARLEEKSVTTKAYKRGVTQAERLAPDVVVLDVRLPGGTGLDACREIKAHRPGTRVVILTSFPDDEVLFDAIACGAEGYVLKEIGSDELIRALEMNARPFLDAATLFMEIRAGIAAAEPLFGDLAKTGSQPKAGFFLFLN